jgi:hypothetical protein
MKKLITIILILAMLLPAAALADLPDISGLTFDELIQLREQVNAAIVASPEFKQVEVPPGFWKIGVDIPAGYWTITPVDGQYMNLWYGDVANESESDAGWGWDSVNGYNKTLSTKKKKDGTWEDPDKPHWANINMKEGWYLKNSGTVIITPYIGHQDLGF